MEQDNDTMPLSPPSWTWDALEAADDLKADARDTAAADRHVGPTVPCWNELPSRRWLVEASRS